MSETKALLLIAGTLLLLVATPHAQTLEQRNGIVNATLLQSMRQFPHHVGIHVAQSTRGHYCSGSILLPRWVLTASSCAPTRPTAQITLMFNRLNANISALPAPQSYAVSIPAEGNVYAHARVNLALVHLPSPLQFSTQVSPIALAFDRSAFGRYAVMPGVRQGTLLQAYGEFETWTDARCSAVYAWYNATEELCTGGWRNSSTVPCSNTVGGGLLLDWPHAPRLVGVFSAPQSCLSGVPAEYVKVSNFLSWIEDVVGRRLQNTGYFV